MNKNSFLSTHRLPHRRDTIAWSLMAAAIIGVGAVTSGTVNAQDITAGRIFGRAPAGDTVFARSMDTNLQRPVEANAHGRYTIEPLPIGTYRVVLEDHGQPVLQHLNVPVLVGSGSEVDFDCAKYRCTQLASKP